MPSANLYAGLQDPCCTLLETGGAAYLMVAHAAGVETRNGEHGGVRVHAQIYAIHEQGQRSLLVDSVVFTAAAAHVLDSVRCVHVADRYLVVYFLDRDTAAGNYVLKARYVDTQAFDSAISWPSMSDITPDDAGLYDVKQVYNAAGTSEYMLAWATTTTQVIIRRVTGADHTATPWSTTITSNHADRILAVHGDGVVANNDGGVAVLYQGTLAAANQLRIHVLDYSDGTDISGAGGSVCYSGHTADYASAGMVLSQPESVSTTPRVGIIAAFNNLDLPGTFTEEDFAHHLVMREFRINGTPTGLGNAHVTPNLHMLSKPFSYVDAEGDRHIYCGLAYTTTLIANPYGEQRGFTCDMGLQHWGEAGDTVRPRPVASYPLANVDARNHGYSPAAGAGVSSSIGKRINHLSNWAPGPSWLSDLRKARAVAWPTWSGVRSVEDPNAAPPGGSSGSRPEPAGAEAKLVWYVIEDPWTANRDPMDHAQPSNNFHGSNPLTSCSNTDVQDQLLIAGGTPHVYDGKHVVELGFPWAPEIIDVADAGGGTIPAGVYRYTAVYEWRGSDGQLHRSGHGNVIYYTAPGAQAADLTIRTLTLSGRQAAWISNTLPPVTVVVYRTTLAQPNLFRRVFAASISGNTIADTPVNNPASWAITATDNVANSILSACPVLSYIDGGNAQQYTELPPYTPPAAALVANWQNRAWLAASETQELWYSKENLPTAAEGRIAPEFNPALRYLLDVVEGEVTGLHPLNDDLIVFTRDGIYGLSGIGPDSLGNGAAYNLEVIHRGTGCIEPRSIVEIPQGIMFQSYKGMYLLDRGKEVDFISAGAPIEDLIRQAGNVRGAAYLPDRHMVAFVANGAVTADPVVIKWDIFHRQWCTATPPPPNGTNWLSSTAGGTAWRGNERDACHVILHQGNLLIERGRDDATPYQDEDNLGSVEPVRIDIETGWIKLAGIAGYKRVYEIGVQGDGGTEWLYGELDVDVDGSFSEASPEDHRIASPGPVPGYFRIRPLTQKMAAFKLRLYEPIGIDAADLRLNGIAITVGLKKGLRRVPNTQIAEGV